MLALPILSMVFQLFAWRSASRLLKLAGRPPCGYLLFGAFMCMWGHAGVSIVLIHAGKLPADPAATAGQIFQLVFSGALLAGLQSVLGFVRRRSLARAPQGGRSESILPQTPSVPPSPQGTEEVGDPGIICGTGMEIMELNQSALRLLGYSRDELCGKFFSNLVRAEEMLLVADIFRPDKLGESSEWHLKKSADELLAVSITTRPHACGQIRLILHDLTEEKAIQSASDAELARLANLEQFFQSAPLALATGDAEGRVVLWNKTMAKLTGKDATVTTGVSLSMVLPQLEGQAFADSVEDELKETAKAHLDKLRHGQDAECELRFARPDGSSVWAIVSRSALKTDDAKPAGCLLMVTDITERKRANDQLRASEQRFRHAVDSLPDLIWMSGPDKKCAFFNRTWLEFTGRSLEELTGAGWTDSIHGEDRGRMLAAYEAAFDKREQFQFEYRLRRHDGEYRWLLGTGIPRQTPEGEFEGYISSCIDITDRRQVEEELRASQRQLEWAQQRARLGSWEFYPEKGTRRWSTQTFALYNNRSEVAPASPEEFTQFICEDDRERLELAHRKVLGTGRPATNVEYRTNPEKGPLRHLNATIYRLPYEDGSGYYLGGTVMDISDQKNAEETLRRNEDRYRRIVETAEEGVWMMDAEGYTSFVNPRMVQMLGYKYREFIGRHFFEFLESESLKEAKEYMERRPQGISEQAEFRFRRKNGKPLWALINSSSLKDEDGEFVGVLSMVTDISERKSAEQALHDSREQLRSVLETAPDFILTIDRKKNIRFINRPYQDTQLQQIIGTSALNWIAPDHRDRYEETLDTAFETGSPQEIELAGIGAANPNSWFCVRVGPVKEGDEIVSLTVVAEDITGRKTVERSASENGERLKILSQKLLAAQETERRMIANELHNQFGQGLSAAKINLESLGQTTQTEKNQKRVSDSLDSLEKLIQQVRRLSLELRPSILDDLGLEPALRWLISHQAETVGYEFDLNLDPLPGRLGADLETVCFRVTQEALTNIARHAKAKKVYLELRVKDGKLHLTIKDDGIGFNFAEARKRASQEGTSLGLLGMEERVHLCGGKFELTSSKKKGSTVSAVIPL
jgi:PAS domain S-box-containing protein